MEASIIFKRSMALRISWLQLPLALILLMPLYYYPLANKLLIPFLTSFAPRLANSSRTIVALTLGLLVVIVLVIDVFTHRTKLGSLDARAIIQRPENWGSLLALWIAATTVFQWQPTSAQNITAYLITLVILYATWFNTSMIERALRAVTVIFAVLFSVVGIIGIFNYSVFLFVGSNPRLYATYCVISICMVFSVQLPQKFRLVLIASLYVAIVVSESRAAFVAGLVAAIVGLIVSARRPLRVGLVSIIGGVITLVITLRIPIIAERMEVSSITSAGLSINDSGRAEGWRVVIDSFLGAPTFGRGAGSGQTVTLRDASPIDHPHSEYLRILHDGGLIAAVLALIFIGLLLWNLRPRMAGKVRDPLIVAGFLLIVAGLILGTIENFLVFPSLMWPGAVLVGLGLKRSREELSGSSARVAAC